MVDQTEVRDASKTKLLSQSVCLGLLVAACINRAPEGTFGSAVAEVGVHDLLKVRPSPTASANYLDIV